MQSYDYSGQTVLITGAGSGFGALAAERFAECGATLALSDINAAAVEATAARIGKPDAVLAMGCDVSKADEVQDFVDATIARFGRIDVALNNAGIGHGLGRIADTDEDTFDRNVAVNLKGVFLCMRAEIPQMLKQGGGVILNTSSVAGITGAPMMGAYAAAKHGVIGLTRTAALEYAKRNIRVNAICPAYTRTPILGSLFDDAGSRTLENMAAAIPLKRLGEPAEIVQAMLWICSKGNSFMTGQALTLDGGLTAG